MLEIPRLGALSGAALVSTALLLTGCSAQAEAETSADATTVTIETNTGAVEVPVDPERVAVLDNSAFATLLEWGVEPVAVPKPLLPPEGFEDWAENEEILDAGGHWEPNLEAVSEAEPDLIIGGLRFADYSDELSSIATVVDIAPSEESEGGYVEGLRAQTEALGQIFDREEEAAELIAELDEAAAAASEATNGETVFLANSSGGKIDNGAGRISRILDEVDLVDVFATQDLDSDSVHADSGLAPETVAQANPDWMIVLDRDAIAAEGEYTPAKQIVEGQEAWASTTFMSEGQIIYLAPDFYVTEGIHAYTDVYLQIAEAFSA
ncbi:ABC transporter substrate-binding protein [Salinibacterium sp. SYSU T00001]|uniref:ABC transporter substrate-binding protein n=1 Tax=Homoserinimonas sedimenticola TaxID=2986805 RepID=UPI002236B77F|nr:ABC transporter substrate-binding protein [Salinibacterium sedimenticola]MCW4384724.1 ABC transporter substrate-binding protein [Salinibacterium sedimenticola]